MLPRRQFHPLFRAKRRKTPSRQWCASAIRAWRRRWIGWASTARQGFPAAAVACSWSCARGNRRKPLRTVALWRSRPMWPPASRFRPCARHWAARMAARISPQRLVEEQAGRRRFATRRAAGKAAFRYRQHWGVAKLVKARDFDSRMRRFESCRPSHPESLDGGSHPGARPVVRYMFSPPSGLMEPPWVGGLAKTCSGTASFPLRMFLPLMAPVSTLQHFRGMHAWTVPAR